MTVNSNTIKGLWDAVSESEDINLYIHTPFCYCQCRYCLYRGIQVSKDNPIIDTFVNNVLLTELSIYKNILSRHPVNTIYFGGGTPNVLNINSLKKIKSYISDIFNNAENRIIEINPAYCNKEYIDRLTELGFTLITFGIQSFDKKSLDKQKRPYVHQDILKEYIDICRNKNVLTSIDIMTYLDTYTKRDLAVLENDIKISKSVDMDFVTIYPELNLINVDKNACDNYIKKIKDINLNGYWLNDKELNKNNNPVLVTRMVKNKYDKEFYKRHLLPYKGNDFPYACQNIIGVGHYGDSCEVMSYSPRRFYYVASNYKDKKIIFNLKYNSL